MAKVTYEIVDAQAAMYAKDVLNIPITQISKAFGWAWTTTENRIKKERKVWEEWSKKTKTF
jgi:nicotinamide riboside transporter PnuC